MQRPLHSLAIGVLQCGDVALRLFKLVEILAPAENMNLQAVEVEVMLAAKRARDVGLLFIGQRVTHRHSPMTSRSSAQYFSSSPRTSPSNATIHQRSPCHFGGISVA